MLGCGSLYSECGKELERHLAQQLPLGRFENYPDLLN